MKIFKLFFLKNYILYIKMPPKKAQAVYKDTPNNRKLNRVGKPLGDPQFKISKSAPATNFDKKPVDKRIAKPKVFLDTKSKQEREALIKQINTLNKKEEEIYELIDDEQENINTHVLAYKWGTGIELEQSGKEFESLVKKELDLIKKYKANVMKNNKVRYKLIQDLRKIEKGKTFELAKPRPIGALAQPKIKSATANVKIKKPEDPKLTKALKRLEILMSKPKSIIVKTLIKEQQFIIKKLQEILRVKELMKKTLT